VSVRDNNGCVTNGSTLTINEPTLLTIDSETPTDITCNGAADGTITISVSGGTAPYEYSIDGGVTFVSNGGSFTGLSAGKYDVSVRDNNGCVTNGSTPTITDPPILTVSGTGTDVTVNSGNDGTIDITVTGGTLPYIFSWTTIDGNGLVPEDEDQTGLTAGNYDVTITDKNGCTVNDSFTISEPGALNLTAVLTDISCNGDNDGTIDITVSGGTTPYTYNWTTTDGTGLVLNSEDQTGLGPGTYHVTVSDINSVTADSSFTISEPIAMVVVVQVTNISCNGEGDGQAQVGVTGGSGTIVFNWSDGQTGNTAINLVAGNYSVTGMDGNGCSVTKDFEIKEPPPLVINPQITDVSCPGETDGVIDLNISGGTAPYSATWQDMDTSLVKTGLAEGNYQVNITDAQGCPGSADMTVSFRNECLMIPKVFTPNGDGKNDTWMIRGIEAYPNVSIKVYSRWGQIIFSSIHGYDQPWDGTYKGKDLPMDSYQYIIDPGNGSEVKLGSVTIIR